MVRARLKREKNLFDTWSRRRKENTTSGYCKSTRPNTN